MIFQGDLSKYHPADALMFLSQLSLNGVLSVALDDRVLTLSFKEGALIDAHSLVGDEKILRMLRGAKFIDADAEQRIRRIRSETGMSVRQVLGELDAIALTDIREILQVGMQEVLLELFLLETGTFHFTDTIVDPDKAGIKLDTGAVAIMALAHADDLRNFIKTIVTLDRGIGWRLDAARPDPPLTASERTLARIASRPLTVKQLLVSAPSSSHAAMRLVEKHLAAGGFYLLPVPEKPDGQQPIPDNRLDPLFTAYKQSLKMLMRAEDVLKKLEAVIAFCKNYYTGILIFTARDRHVMHCKSISINKDGSIHQKSIKAQIGTLDQDPVFDAVHRSGVAFFGKVFPSSLISQVADVPAAGECALLPILKQSHLSMFFYGFTATSHSGLSPHHYLELLSWMIIPSGERSARTGAQGIELPSAEPLPVSPPAGAGGPLAMQMTRMVEKIEDLPPLPSLASKTLELLADPNASMESVEQTIAQDQAMAAKMIKVSNSVLYGGLQKVGTLRQALTRLGAKTTKSLILAASTRGYFLKGRKSMQSYGHHLWQHSVECGIAARRIAVAGGGADPDQAYIAGIMHDIGKLVILMLDEEKYKAIQHAKSVEKSTDQAAERKILGVDHAELGHLLMQKWRMPEPVRACTQFHHQPVQAGAHQALTAIVALGNHFSQLSGSRPRDERPEDAAVVQALCGTIGLSAQAYTDILETIVSDFRNADLME
jgi:HD-like signal output (HDOD) protein